jgi:Type II secretion system (T2SS), protein M
MTTRDRLMLIGIVVLAVLVGGYMTVVAPERKQASKVSGEVQSARQQLQTAETQAAEAASARSRYGSAYASLVSLGPAVPASDETPSLVYALATATHNRKVDFESISSSAESKGSGSSGSGSSSPASAASALFVQEPFSLGFNGSFVDLDKLLAQLEGFTTEATSGALRVSGRLLTISGVQLASSEAPSGSAGGGSKSGLKVTVTATAYLLPPGQTPLAGAAASGPSGAAAASSGAAGSSPPSTAVIKAGAP